MRKLVNPEIALGFLVATVFWIGALAWQASYAPRDSERRQCEETATKEGRKTEECKTLWERTTSDPVAFFTFWLVVFTGGLTVSTVLLWRAGERQFQLLSETSAAQSRDMQASLNIANRSAHAAEKAAEASNLNAKAAIGVELPIVSIAKAELHRAPGVAGQIAGGHVPAEITLAIDFKNRGRTAAELHSITVQCEVVRALPPTPIYKFNSKHPFAPGIYMEADKPLPTGNFRLPIKLLPEEVAAIEDETAFLWVFGFLSYADFMGEPHESRFCAKWVRYGVQPDGSLKPIGFIYDSETPPAYTRQT